MSFITRDVMINNKCQRHTKRKLYKTVFFLFGPRNTGGNISLPQEMFYTEELLSVGKKKENLRWHDTNNAISETAEFRFT